MTWECNNDLFGLRQSANVNENEWREPDIVPAPLPHTRTPRAWIAPPLCLRFTRHLTCRALSVSPDCPLPSSLTNSSVDERASHFFLSMIGSRLPYRCRLRISYFPGYPRIPYRRCSLWTSLRCTSSYPLSFPHRVSGFPGYPSLPYHVSYFPGYPRPALPVLSAADESPEVRPPLSTLLLLVILLRLGYSESPFIHGRDVSESSAAPLTAVTQGHSVTQDNIHGREVSESSAAPSLRSHKVSVTQGHNVAQGQSVTQGHIHGREVSESSAAPSLRSQGSHSVT